MKKIEAVVVNDSGMKLEEAIEKHGIHACNFYLAGVEGEEIVTDIYKEDELDLLFNENPEFKGVEINKEQILNKKGEYLQMQQDTIELKEEKLNYLIEKYSKADKKAELTLMSANYLSEQAAELVKELKGKSIKGKKRLQA